MTVEPLVLATLAAVATWRLRSRDQGRRIALLGSHLGKYQIEKLLETVTQGYLRALGEPDPERRAQIWNLLGSAEEALSSQFERFADDFLKVDEADARVSTLPIYLPFAARLLPASTFDMREALAIHARGIADAIRGSSTVSARDRAFTVSAELFLMQHTCHWFCKSRTVASARMLARHKTSHEQLVASVSPQTRAAYFALLASR